MSEPILRAELPTGIGFVNLRGNPGNDAFREAVEAGLGQTLPLEPNTISDGRHRVYWLGPDEWLITTEAGSVPALVADLEKRFADMHTAVNDVSGGNVAFRLTGAGARDLLAKGCTLDLHPRAFAVGDCAQSGLGKTGALIGLVDDTPTFEVIVRRSFAGYLEKWLRHAGRDRGIEFV
jgi:sarcosine oxidase subunit gamma